MPNICFQGTKYQDPSEHWQSDNEVFHWTKGCIYGTNQSLTELLCYMNDMIKYIHLKSWVIMMPTLSSLAIPQVVIMTTCGVASDGKVGIMTAFCFQWLQPKKKIFILQFFFQ